MGRLETYFAYRRGVSWSSFAAVLVLLFLPLATFSYCGETESTTGAHLALLSLALLGDTLAGHPEELVLASFSLLPVAAVLGAGFQLWGQGRRSVWVSFLCAVVGLLILGVQTVALARLGDDWHWQPAYYGLWVALALPATACGADLLLRRRLQTEQRPP